MKGDSNPVLAAALSYAARNWPVFPCNPTDKSPLTKNGFKDATLDRKQITKWWRKHRDAMIGVPTGAVSGFVAIDLDRKTNDEDGVATWEQWEAEHGATRTRTHVTPSTGQHRLFRFVPGIRNIPLDRIGPGIEVKGDGGYIIVPPSVMSDGRAYTGDEHDVADAPPWLITKLEEYYRPRRETHDRTAMPEGDSRFRQINDAALQNLDAWVPRLFPNAKRSNSGWRVTSSSLGRALEEDISITAEGIKDFGVHDMGDAREGRRSPIDLVIEHGTAIDDAVAAARWLCAQLELPWEDVQDFHAYMPKHNYIYVPTREPWPGVSVNARIPPVPLFDANGEPLLGDNGEPVKIKASTWLDQNRHVEQMTWAPGEPLLIRDRLIAEGGWIMRSGDTCFNLYLPPTIKPGDPTKAGPWLEHVHMVFGDDAEHIIKWLAQRVQHPQIKINHALVFGSNKQGTGKDTLLEPVKRAVGPWNFQEISPQQVLGRFNGFLKKVILRVNEARDLGDVNRYQFYDHMKAYTAAPPDVLRVDEKNLREHSILNCVGVILTTNYKTNGIYLPAEDRRHFVAWSGRSPEDYPEGYWNTLWRWYDEGGDRHVAAYLAELDIKTFDPKAPPPKTQAFWDIVEANRAPEDAELADVLDKLGNPDAVTLGQIKGVVAGYEGFSDWLNDRRNSRAIPHRLEACGYVAIRNDTNERGFWILDGRRQVVYAKASLSIREQMKAASELSRPAPTNLFNDWRGAKGKNK